MHSKSRRFEPTLRFHSSSKKDGLAMRGLGLLGSLFAIVIAFSAIAPSASAYEHKWGTLVIGGFSCHYGKVTITMTWSGNSPYAAGQYVQMSYNDNGWKPYTTTTVGPFKPKINTMSWDGLKPNTRHFLRFNQQFADGSWDPSLTFRFDTPGCSADGFTVVYNTMGQLGDYDCLGGEGNGPNYVEGQVTVGTWDPYGLDGDGDSIGCEDGEGG
jgi:hypothetical protein